MPPYSPSDVVPSDTEVVKARRFSGLALLDPRFRCQTEPLGPEAIKIAEDQLRETPERVRESLAQLRELLKDEDELNFRTDDDILLIFLRPTKFYPESALALMKRVAQFKDKYSSVLSGLNSLTVKDAFLNSKVVNVLTDRDQHGRRILVANLGAVWDTSQVTSDHLFRLFYMIHLTALLEPETQVRGVVVILDFENMGRSQCFSLNPAFSIKLLTFIQDAMPLRLKEVHIVKEPMIFKIVWNIFKPLLREKLRSRLFMHGSKMANLHKYMDPERLPANYGGKLPAIDYSSADWFPCVTTIEPHLVEWDSFGLKKK